MYVCIVLFIGSIVVNISNRSLNVLRVRSFVYIYGVHDQKLTESTRQPFDFTNVRELWKKSCEKNRLTEEQQNRY